MTDGENAAVVQRAPARGGSFGALGPIIGTLVAAWAAALASRPLNDNSFLTHLATGRLILAEGHVPTRDPYTFTALGEPWTVQSWLASVGYASFERLGGAVGLRLLLVIVYVAAAALLWQLTRPAESLLVRIGLIAGALFVGTGLWTERPYMVGVIGLALTLLALDRRVPWWVLVPTMWIWGNSHGSYAFAPALVLLVVLGGALDRRASWRRVPDHELKAGVAVFAGTALAAVGPLGLRVLSFPFTAAQRSETFREVIEWQAPAFRSTSELAYLAFVLASIVVLSRWGRQWRLILPMVAFVGLSLYAQRNIVVATVVLVAVVAHAAPTVGTLRASDRPRLGGVMATITAIMFVAVVASTLSTAPNTVDDYAAGPLAWLEATGLDGRRVATDALVGNLLEALDGAQGKVFVDDRFDMLPDEVFQDYLTLVRSGPRWDEVLEDHQIDVVVWQRSSGTGSLLATSVDWRIAFSDAAWVVAVRRDADRSST